MNWITTLKIITAVLFLWWISQYPGSFVLNWFDYKIELSIIGAAAFLIVFVSIYGLIKRSVNKIFKRKTVPYKGIEALQETIEKLILKDQISAERSLNKTKKYLGHKQPLVYWLEGLKHLLQGNKLQAERIFHELSSSSKGDFLGSYSLYKLSNDDLNQASQSINSALRIYPLSKILLKEAFNLALKQNQFDTARKHLSKMKKESTDIQQLEAISFYLESFSSNNQEYLLKKAFKLTSSIPAIVIKYAEVLIELNKTKLAKKIISEVLNEYQHPELFDFFIKLHAEKTLTEQVALIKEIANKTPRSWVAQYCLGSISYSAGFWGAARQHFLKSYQLFPNSEVCLKLAEIEQLLSSDNHSEWEERAKTMSPFPKWVCNQCSYESDIWNPICGRCGNVGSFTWKSPVIAITQKHLAIDDLTIGKYCKNQ